MNHQKLNMPECFRTPIFLFTAASLLLLGLASCSKGYTPANVSTSATVVYGGYWGGGYYPYYRSRYPGWVGPPGYRPPGSRPPGARPPRPVQLPTVTSTRRPRK